MQVVYFAFLFQRYYKGLLLLIRHIGKVSFLIGFILYILAISFDIFLFAIFSYIFYLALVHYNFGQFPLYVYQLLPQFYYLLIGLILDHYYYNKKRVTAKYPERAYLLVVARTMLLYIFLFLSFFLVVVPILVTLDKIFI